MEDKRSVSRRRTYLTAQVASRDGIGLASGLVRNLSASGAMIEGLSASCPEMLALSIPAAGLRRDARVVWRAGARFGVQFRAEVAVAEPRRRATPYDDDPNY